MDGRVLTSQNPERRAAIAEARITELTSVPWCAAGPSHFEESLGPSV